jgi:hypothetical protein
MEEMDLQQVVVVTLEEVEEAKRRQEFQLLQLFQEMED